MPQPLVSLGLSHHISLYSLRDYTGRRKALQQNLGYNILPYLSFHFIDKSLHGLQDLKMARALLLACFLVVAVMATVTLAQWNPNYYPGLAPGWGGIFHNSYPPNNYGGGFGDGFGGGYGGGCRYWCRSSYTNQYYCCQTPSQAALTNPYYG